MTPARTTAASEEAPEAAAVTTVLYAGWNLVGWVGHEALVADLFDAIPTLQQVSAWDAEDGAYRHAVRLRYDELPAVKPATALWLRLHAVPLGRAGPLDGRVAALLRLSEGINLVAVADTEAVGRLGGGAGGPHGRDGAVPRLEPRRLAGARSPRHRPFRRDSNAPASLRLGR